MTDKEKCVICNREIPLSNNRYLVYRDQPACEGCYNDYCEGMEEDYYYEHPSHVGESQ